MTQVHNHSSLEFETASPIQHSSSQMYTVDLEEKELDDVNKTFGHGLGAEKGRKKVSAGWNQGGKL